MHNKCRGYTEILPDIITKDKSFGAVQNGQVQAKLKILSIICITRICDINFSSMTRASPRARKHVTSPSKNIILLKHFRGVHVDE